MAAISTGPDEEQPQSTTTGRIANLSKHLYDLEELRCASQHAARQGNVADKGFVDVELDLSGESKEVWKCNAQTIVEDIGVANPTILIQFMLLRKFWTTLVTKYAADVAKDQKVPTKDMFKYSFKVADAQRVLVSMSVLVTRSVKCGLSRSAVVGSMMDATHAEKLDTIYRVNNLDRVDLESPVSWFSELTAPSAALGSLVKISPTMDNVEGNSAKTNVNVLDPIQVGKVWYYCLKSSIAAWTTVKNASISAASDEEREKCVQNAQTAERVLLAATQLVFDLEYVEQRDVIDVATRPLYAFVPLQQDKMLSKWLQYFPEIMENSDCSCKMKKPAFWRRLTPHIWSTLLVVIPKSLGGLRLTLLSLLELIAEGLTDDRTTAVCAVLITARSSVCDSTMTQVNPADICKDPVVSNILELYNNTYDVLSDVSADTAISTLHARRRLDLRPYVDRTCLRGDGSGKDTRLDLARYIATRCAAHVRNSFANDANAWSEDAIAKSHGRAVVESIAPNVPLPRVEGDKTVNSSTTPPPLKSSNTALYRSLEILKHQVPRSNGCADYYEPEYHSILLGIESTKSIHQTKPTMMQKWRYKHIVHKHLQVLLTMQQYVSKTLNATPLNDNNKMSRATKNNHGKSNASKSITNNNDNKKDNNVVADADENGSTLNTVRNKKSKNQETASEIGSFRTISEPDTETAMDVDEISGNAPLTIDSRPKKHTASSSVRPNAKKTGARRKQKNDPHSDQCSTDDADHDGIESVAPKNNMESKKRKRRSPTKETDSSDKGEQGSHATHGGVDGDGDDDCNEANDRTMPKPAGAKKRKNGEPESSVDEMHKMLHEWFHVEELGDDGTNAIEQLILAQTPTSHTKKFVIIGAKHVYKGPFLEENYSDMACLVRCLFRVQIMRSQLLQEDLVHDMTIVYNPENRVYYLRMLNIATTPNSTWAASPKQLKTHNNAQVNIIERDVLGIFVVAKKMDSAAVHEKASMILANLMARYVLAIGDSHLGQFITNTKNEVVAIDFEDQREMLPLLGQIQEPLFVDCLFSKKPNQKDMAIVDKWIHDNVDSLVDYCDMIASLAKPIECVAKRYNAMGLRLSEETILARVQTLKHTLKPYKA